MSSYYPPPQGYGQNQPPPQGYGQPPPAPYGSRPYGAPPPNQYPPPQQGYPQHPSYPPPQNQPANAGYYQQNQNYQPYPPQPPAPYGGAPPPPNQYAQPYAAPQGQYPQGPGQYPPPAGNPYPPPNGAPYGAPPQQYGPPNPPSLGYDPYVQAQVDLSAEADALRKAMKGIGTDEKTLINVLVRQDPIRAVHLKQTFDRNFRRDLEKDITSETSGWFRAGLLALVRGPLMNDVHALHDAIDGVGTDEDLLNDVLLSRSNLDLRAVKENYRRKYHRDLDKDVAGELSMKTQRHFAMVLAANRAEDSAPINPQETKKDVLELYKATEGKSGTDELMVCSILSSRSDTQLRAIGQEYTREFRVDFETVIKKEFSGHMKSALLMQFRGATNRPLRDAELLEDAMKGAGTKDRWLITRLVRYHWDRNYMQMVRQAYHQRFRRDLGSRVKGETSGDYERLCLALLNA